MSDLAYVLRQLPPVQDPNLLLGDNPADDAAIYRVRDDLALVQTLDFFTPIVDDPYTYGQIAAANSLSDVYAVGATPLTALNVAAFPVDTLSLDILGDILRGGAEMARSAGIPIIGGHTVSDQEPKYGLVVTGTVDPTLMVTPRGARPGDLLFLTKPIGTGVIATAHKTQTVESQDLETAIRWMLTLNRRASLAMVRSGASAATDITGFGLLGHLVDLCRASEVAAEVRFSAVPLLPSALRYARVGAVPGGALTNRAHVTSDVELVPSLDEAEELLLVDPQTSGGLLVAIPEAQAETFMASQRAGLLTAEIGRIESGPAGRVRVVA